jgi:hypothetical protein
MAIKKKTAEKRKTARKAPAKRAAKAAPVLDKKGWVTEPKIAKLPNKPIILIGHWEGRFGNRMHQYAYCAHYAKKFGYQFVTPSQWEGDRLFKNQFHKVLDDDELRQSLNQTDKRFDNINFRSAAVTKYSFRSLRGMSHLNPDEPTQTWAGLGNVWIASVCAYNPEIFKNLSRKYTRETIFEFSDEVKNLDVYKALEDKQGTYDIAHLRRDDISNPNYETNFGYSVLSQDSYRKAFEKFGYDPEKIEWTTDDWTGNWGVGKPSDNDWFTRKGSWRYPEGSEHLEGVVFDWLPDFLRLYFARTIFRANSSFSFWAAFLSNAKVFAPVLDRREIYSGSKGSGKEIDVEFIEGNHPHWLVQSGQAAEHIIIPE